MNYRCRIEIDVEAIDPVAAANQAYELMWAADAMKPVVDVFEMKKPYARDVSGPRFNVDLNETPSMQVAINE